MIKLVVFAAAAICLAGASSDDNPELDYQEFTEILLDYPFGDIIHPKILEESKKFNYEEALKTWNDTQVLIEFWAKYKDGILERGAIYSYNNPVHVNESELFSKALSYAPTDELFFTFAAWAHVHLNRGIFVNGFIVALTYRESTSQIILLPPYRIFPYYYFPSDALKLLGEYYSLVIKENFDTTPSQKSIWINVTSSYTRDTPDYKLDYFYNDIGLNARNFYSFIKQFSYVPSDEYPESIKRGLNWLSYHTAFINRISMEYRSHNIKTNRYFSWRNPKIPSYMPSMVYENGVTFTQREQLPHDSSRFMQLSDEIMGLEQIIRETIAIKQLILPGGKQSLIDNTFSSIGKLANVFQGNSDSPNDELYKSYERLGQKILGYSDRRGNNWEQFPNSLENPSTVLRDPASYMLYSRIIDYSNDLKEQLHPHTLNELADKNLAITKFKVDKIFTYIKPYDTLIANISAHNETFPIKARQMRLNHHPLRFHLSVKSEKIVKIVIRVSMGPTVKYHDMSDFKYHSQFYPVYCNVREVVVGNNDLVLNSEDNLLGSPDFDEHPWSGEDFKNPRLVVFPKRMIYPRGNCDGMPVKYYVYIREHDPESDHQLCGDKPFEYPFERRIENMTMPNMDEYYGKIFFDNDHQPEHSDE